MSDLSRAIIVAKRHTLISLARFILEAEEEAGKRGEDWTEDSIYRALEAWADEVELWGEVT